jgi:hypothetical protein
MADENALSRFQREWDLIPHASGETRKSRGWNNRTSERRDREWVDYTSRTPQGDTD